MYNFANTKNELLYRRLKQRLDLGDNMNRNLLVRFLTLEGLLLRAFGGGFCFLGRNKKMNGCRIAPGIPTRLTSRT